MSLRSPKGVRQQLVGITEGAIGVGMDSRRPVTPEGRGTDQPVLDVLGDQPFRDDLLLSPGLDDRLARNGYLSEAKRLMAFGTVTVSVPRRSFF